MQKFPFTNEGFQELQAALYVLPDAALELEAAAIKLNFKNWMVDHFELVQSQIAFLQDLDERVLSLISFETSFAVGNRLAVSLIKKDPPTDDEIDKIIWPKSTLSALSGTKTAYHATGTLEINVSYQR